MFKFQTTKKREFYIHKEDHYLIITTLPRKVFPLGQLMNGYHGQTTLT